MKFKSRKDTFFNVVIYTVLFVLCIPLYISIFKSSQTTENIIGIITIIASILLIIWIFHRTHYEIRNNNFKYRSGPIYGTIEISSITKIIKGKTMWVGLKPATAKNGLIIKYNNFNEIYISPETNELFISEVLKQNNAIIIEE